MALLIVRRSERVTVTERFREFEDASCPGAGYAFELDESGEIIVTDGNRENVERCLRGEGVIDRGISERHHHYHEPAVGKCRCGREVLLTDSRGGNDCRCGRIYNSFGQELAPRSQWGEETGETYSDIIRPLGDFEVI